jgi:hypothetical protein
MDIKIKRGQREQDQVQKWLKLLLTLADSLRSGSRGKRGWRGRGEERKERRACRKTPCFANSAS